mgnify:CR=1 FL=1
MSLVSNPTVLLHADPTHTELDTGYVSNHVRLDVASAPESVFGKLDSDPEIGVVIVDARTTDAGDCERVVGRIADRGVRVLLLTGPDPGPAVLTLDADAHLSAPTDPEAVVRTVRRLAEHGVDDGDDGSRSRARALGGSAVSAEPRYRRYPVEFYLLWFLAAAAYGFGDVLSTVLAVFTGPGVVEANPLVAVVLEDYGLPGFLAVKLVILVVLVLISVDGARADDRFSYYWPPIVATVMGATLTAWNLWLLYG